MSALFTWWLVAEVLGIVVLPLTVTVFTNLPDRGWGLARPLGLLLTGWLVWFPLALVPALPFNRAWIIGTLLVLALGNVALLRVPETRAALVHLLVRERGYLLAGEGVFAGSLALMGWVRSFTPAVVDTEKFMDVAFLSSLWRTSHLPAPDPWLAGQPINYYYFGHYLMALVAKLLGTVPAVAFNTSVALVFALVASAVFAVVVNLVAVGAAGRSLLRAAPFGVCSVLLVLVAGNLDGARQWWRAATALAAQPGSPITSPWAWWLHPDLWVRYDWWASSRVIVKPSYTINEFPAFSFMLADLHAHVLALPWAALALGVALNLLRARGKGLAAFGPGRGAWLGLGVAAVALGALYAINGWDLPTYLALVLVAFALGQWVAHERRWDREFVANLAIAAALLVALAVLAYLPFYRGFVSPAQGVGIVPPAMRSAVGDEFAIFGLPALLVGSLLVVRLAALLGDIFAPERAEEATFTRQVAALGVGGCFALLALLAWRFPAAQSLTLSAVLLVIAGCGTVLLAHILPGAHWRLWLKDVSVAEIYVWCMVGLAAALVGAAELVYLRDVFDGGNYFRMNTVFKLYYQAWLLLGVASGPALAWLLARVHSRLAWSSWLPATAEGARPPIRALLLRWFGWSGTLAWTLALAALLGAAAIYPVQASAARTAGFALPRSLDGTAFMAGDPLNRGDDAAIAWLNDPAHVAGNPTIVEASGAEYTHFDRVSAFTGLPTVLGWFGHEVQWRVNWLARPGNTGELERRKAAVDQIYTSADPAVVAGLLRHYEVRYVYVGLAERQQYPAVNMGRFPALLRVVYQSADVTIYRVR
jgi:YYY domain-containing protein